MGPGWSMLSVTQASLVLGKCPPPPFVCLSENHFPQGQPSSSNFIFSPVFPVIQGRRVSLRCSAGCVLKMALAWMTGCQSNTGGIWSPGEQRRACPHFMTEKRGLELGKGAAVSGTGAANSGWLDAVFLTLPKLTLQGLLLLF